MKKSHMSKSQYVVAAIERRSVEKVLQLISTPGFDINFCCKNKGTPLIIASKLGLFSVCEQLIKLGADVTSADDTGRTALHHACCHGHHDITNLLIGAGCSVHMVNYEGDQPLHEAVTSRDVDTVQLLLDAGSDVNRPNHVTGNTPLDLAVLYSSPGTVEALIKSGANIHHKSRALETALHLSVQVGCTAVIQHLLDAGADINGGNHLAETPLTIAIQEKQLDTVKYLVQAGCRFTYTGYMSSLCVACRQNSPDVIGYLLSEGYNVSLDTTLQRYIFLQLEESRPRLLAYVYYLYENPRTLKEQCRIAMRRSLGRSVRERVPLLCLPESLKTWLVMDNVYTHL